MKIYAIQKNLRQTPRKVRLVANQIKNLSLQQAMQQLAVMERRSSLALLKVVKQAIANAMNNHRLAFEDLNLSSIKVTQGPTFKRWNPVSRGRAHSIMKRTSHVTVELEAQKLISTKADQPIKLMTTAEEKIVKKNKIQNKRTTPKIKSLVNKVKKLTPKLTKKVNQISSKPLIKRTQNK